SRVFFYPEGVSWQSPGSRFRAPRGKKWCHRLYPEGVSWQSPGSRFAHPGNADRPASYSTPKGFYPLIPDISLVPWQTVLGQQPPELVLERLGAMVLFLVRNVTAQGLRMGWTDGKGAVAVLPVERCQVWRLRLEPFAMIRASIL